MKKVLLSFLLLTSYGALASADTINGYVSESHCGAKHSAVSAANSKCIAVCLKKGSDPVLVRDGKVLAFDADSKEKAKAFAGETVSIDGSIDGGVVKISSINKAD